MSRLEEQLTEQFRLWEARGRGWRVFPEPVYPEPPFVPFEAHCLAEQPAIDDGRRPTILSSLVQKLSRKLCAEPEPPAIIPVMEVELEPTLLVRETLVGLQAFLPETLDVPRELFERFLQSLALCREPVAFELVGIYKKVITQFVSHPEDAPLLARQLHTFFTDAIFVSRDDALEKAWEESDGDEVLAVEFGLGREFMLPLAKGKLDPFIGIVGALSELAEHELGLFQVLWQPVENPWAESITRSVTHADRKPFFVNKPELASAADEKTKWPLYAVVVRILVRTEDFGRTLQLARDLAGALRVFADPKGNELIPLTNADYSFAEHVEDVLLRQSRRTGMLLNSDELVGFVHIPSSEVCSPVFVRQAGKTKGAPTIVQEAEGLLLGYNEHAGETLPVRLAPEQRVRHCHIIGASGTGKSTLLFNLIQQDIETGQGLAVLDPHGDLVDKILGVLPESRIKDVVLVDPSDEAFSIGFNILSAHSDLEKNLLASDLVSVFQRLSASWGDQMGSVLNNAILAFLESSRRGTLADVRRFLIEPGFRAEFLKTVNDPAILYYWQKAFPQLSGNKSIGPVLTRLETFLSPKPIRYMVSQTENRLDFAQIMDTGKIFLAKLSQGLLGRENSYLLGTLLVSKFQQLAMARQSQQAAVRRNFWIYLDEFHNFITPSMAEILTGARKYRIGLILAHQELRQLQRDSEVASAVLSNPFTRICFRVGDDDARKLSDGFAFFEARDLQNLGIGQAVARVERSVFDFNLAVPVPKEPDRDEATVRRKEVIAASREKYGTPVAEVEQALRELWELERSSEQPITRPAVVRKEPPVLQPPPPALEIPTPPTPAPSRPPEPAAPLPERKATALAAGLGRGGAQHKAIQHRIKEQAEKLDFRGVIEKEVSNGQGSVDLLLERADHTVACEISLTTTIDHEVQNVAKCLKAGFKVIAIICLDDARLRKIELAVTGSLGQEAAAHVGYYQPDAFIRHLKALRRPEPPPSSPPQTRRGYKVKRSNPHISPEEQKQREEAAIQSIAQAMRQKRGK
jgi:hypothetical protein